MKIIEPRVEILDVLDSAAILRKLEMCGRVCYKSEDKITDESAVKFVRGLLIRGHESVLEHVSFSVRFICDRGVSHEIVRHRIASYSQESTRYCNYSKDVFGGEITVIKPLYLKDGTSARIQWAKACEEAEGAYFNMLKYGCSNQEARAVLPNSLKTELIMTANLREWRHFLRLRCSHAAHPQMRQVALMLLEQLREKLPVVFDGIWEGNHA